MSADLQPHTFIPDIHGDHRALRESLVQAGVAERTRRNIKIVSDDIIVQTGDLLDRGNDNLATLDMILEIMDQTKLKLVAGNHDVLLLHALNNPTDTGVVHMWLRSGGYTTLREVAKGQKRLRRDNYAFPVPVKGLSEEDSVAAQTEWISRVRAHRMARYDFPAALDEMQEMILHGQYAKIFEGMGVMEQPFDNVLAVHAGMTKPWATVKTKDGNRLFQTTGRSGNFHIFLRDNLKKIMWLQKEKCPKKKPLDRETADALDERGIDLIIHGHDRIRSGKQELSHCYGIGVINGDVSMSAAYKRTPNRWGYVRIDERGHVLADSEAGGARDFGRIKDGRYHKPKKQEA